MREPGRDAALSVAAFVALLAAYVAIGLAFKTIVLNWVVGPLFPVVALYVVPHLLRSRRAGEDAP